MAPLRIGVNALYMIPGGVGGTEVYLRSLVEALAAIDTTNQYVLFTNRETGDSLLPPAANFRCVPQAVAATNRPARLIWEQTRLPWEAWKWRLDVLFNPGFTAPAVCGCRQATVFHDLQHKRHPVYFRWYELPFWNLFLLLSAHVSDRLIAVSEATREDLLLFYKLPPGKVATVRHGVDPRFFEIGRQRASCPAEPYLLCVSTLHHHKNIERLVLAFNRFREGQPGFRLVLAGLRGFHTKAVEKLIEDLSLQEQVTITGWIPRERLYELYLRAYAFIYPSTFEGFGMPILEAMAAGIPTACSGIEPLLTIAEKSALFFPPEQVETITATMGLLVNDAKLREKLAMEGPARASRFSWEKSARQTLDVILEAAGQRKKSSS